MKQIATRWSNTRVNEWVFHKNNFVSLEKREEINLKIVPYAIKTPRNATSLEALQLSTSIKDDEQCLWVEIATSHEEDLEKIDIDPQ